MNEHKSSSDENLSPQRSDGEMAERSNAPALKIGEPQGSEGSNPSLSALDKWEDEGGYVQKTP